jgi:hypothetical protein
MPRQNWKQAPEHIQQNVSRWMTTLPALEVVKRTLFDCGYDLDLDEIPQDATTEQARKLWQGRRHWAAHTSVTDDSTFKFQQQRAADDAERARITNERFIDGLVGAVQAFIADQWHRANAQWQATHPRNADRTHEPAAPSFSDTIDAVAQRLGYVRDEATQTRTRKAS